MLNYFLQYKPLIKPSVPVLVIWAISMQWFGGIISPPQPASSQTSMPSDEPRLVYSVVCHETDGKLGSYLTMPEAVERMRFLYSISVRDDIDTAPYRIKSWEATPEDMEYWGIG